MFKNDSLWKIIKYKTKKKKLTADIEKLFLHVYINMLRNKI